MNRKKEKKKKIDNEYRVIHDWLGINEDTPASLKLSHMTVEAGEGK